jgi:O-antigen/teichoic acid export membrane protein
MSCHFTLEVQKDKIKKMKTALKVGENTLWQIGSKATNAISGLIIIGLIQKNFGDTGVGVYSLIIAYVSFYFMPVDFGLNALVVKHLVDTKIKPQKIFSNVLAFRLILSATLILIAIIVASLLPYNATQNTGYSPEVKTGIILVSLTILAQGLLSTANAYFQAKQKYAYSFLANITSAATNVALFGIMLYLSFSLVMAITAFTISGIIGGAVALVLVKRELKTIAPAFDKQYLASLIKDTLPLTVSLMLNLIYFRIDTLILPFYRQIEEVGRYSVAYKIFDTILVIPNYFANALYPVLLQKYNTSVKDFVVTAKKSALSLSAVAIIGSIISYIAAPLMVQIITGVSNQETIQYTRILTSGLILFFLSSIAMWSLIVLGKQKYLAYIYGTTMVINISLNLIFIPIYGAQASAYITILTEALVFALSIPLVIVEIRKKSQ